MNEPPDPGESPPVAGTFVTIEMASNSFAPLVGPMVPISNDSAMDTDGAPSTSNRKRSRVHRCKLCNKRKRKNRGQEIRENDCACDAVPSPVQSPSPSPKKNTNVPMDAQMNVVQPNIEKDSQPSSTLDLSRKCYNNTDVAPYIVHVQRVLKSPNDGSTMHSVSFGKFLQKNGFKNIIQGSVKQIGRNKIALSFSDFTDANSFINHQSLAPNDLKAFIPSFNVTRMGLVRGIPAEWSPEEIIANTKVPIGCGEIIKVRRLNHKTFINGTAKWNPSQSVVITFDGQVLPKRIFVCYNALSVELYIYPTIQCYNCCRFGHTKVQCRSKPRCFKCGQDHTGDSCNMDEDNGSCCLCSGSHFATSKSCPELARQKQIKSYMANNCVSYAEASKLHPPVSKSFADVVSSSPVKKVSQSYRLNVNNETPTSNTHKKTVFLKPRSPPPPTKGYDKQAHQALIKDFTIPTPNNGCALNNTPMDQPSPNLKQITDLIVVLINLLTQFSNNSPPNVASVIDLISQNIQNGSSQDSAVELLQSN
ncbi:hypothetical protein ABMA28_008693 [Loxostege sticticalis]|uniref:Gag-like protein n=1 Tax=Loxostege sticticalis TaxID=481309 RepID=A0ABD0SF69_LOXSC